MRAKTWLRFNKGASFPYVGVILFVFVVNFVQHLPYLQMDIQGKHAWRQTQTMWNIRNFTRHDANILNPRVSHFNQGRNIYRYEFPVMQWSIGMLQRLFGEHILLVRLLLFCIVLSTCLGMYYLCKLWTGDAFTAFVTAVLFQYAPLFYFYTINVLPDNLALCGAVFYLYFYLKFTKTAQLKHLILSSLFLLLATLAKLPFLLFSIVSISFFVVSIFQSRKTFGKQVGYAAIQLAIVFPALLWYAWVMPGWGSNPILKGVFDGGLFNESNWQILKYHIRETFLQSMQTFPLWLIFVVGAFQILKTFKEHHWLYAYIAMTLLYFILEISPIGFVHDYYLMPFLPWVYLVMAQGVQFLSRIHPYVRVALIGLMLFCIFYNPRVMAHYWSQEETYINNDLFKYREELIAAAPMEAKCIILNDVSLFNFSYMIDKRGYIFYNDGLKFGWIKDMINNKGAEYLYSDSEKINKDPKLADYVERLVLDAGSIQVYELKERIEE
ncbi:MAG: glycosyltransferase family 39 protein [Bacteroidota bacterium]